MKQTSLPANSWLMRVLLALGMQRLAWSLRRLHCPVERDALVLEVGSGGNPYLRSNVLLDAFETTRQRHWAPLVADRPTVIGMIERLPFRDQAFDFVIASHVLEHSLDPQAFLDELQRVAKAGYIEVPDAFMERLNPYRDHRLEITQRDGALLIRKKAAWQADPQLVELYEARAKKYVTQELIPRHPFDFHVRYYWQHKIDDEILNPDVDAGWEPPADRASAPVNGLRSRINSMVLAVVRALFSQNRRNRNLQLHSLLACPQCKSIALKTESEAIICMDCASVYPVRHGLPIMLPPAVGGAVVGGTGK